MSEKNTASIGKVLSQNHLEYIPEAHCYIQLEEEKIDLTTPGANLEKIENDILEEFEIEPHEIGGFKVAYHKQYLKNWSKRENHFQSLDELWIIREKCIHNLSSL